MKISVPDDTECWIELADGSCVSIDSASVLRISTWTPEGNCLQTICFDRPLAPAQAGDS